MKVVFGFDVQDSEDEYICHPLFDYLGSETLKPQREQSQRTNTTLPIMIAWS
jgi:hypothetical protein